MAQLIVRNLEAEVVARLRQRAAENGHSAEAEHRVILYQALGLAPQKKLNFKQALLAIPNVGEDSDFQREQDLGRDVELFT